METEKWINEVFNSTKGMIKITPEDSLFFKIQNKINNNKLSSRWLWLAAASLVILITLNVKFVFGKSNANESQTEIIASTMVKSNQLY
jgi:hypothetical protein